VAGGLEYPVPDELMLVALREDDRDPVAHPLEVLDGVGRIQRHLDLEADGAQRAAVRSAEGRHARGEHDDLAVRAHRPRRPGRRQQRARGE
jgi:hypothetical protein